MKSNELGDQYKSIEKTNHKDFDDKFDSNHDLIFIPLGGTGEIGMNVNLYQYKGKWIMVDCGAGFADDSMPGIAMVVADISFIEKRVKDLVAIVLTHAHEDHCGAVQYLWKKLRVPIYTTSFTANLLKRKIGVTAEKMPIYTIESNNFLHLDPFKLEFIHLTHSIPEMNAVIIHTEYGAVVHTGDWKIDNSPVVGLPSNEERLMEIGNSENGVISMVCDSTNVFSPGRSSSESELHMSLYDIILKCSGAVAITLFASNVARIEIICAVAKELGKNIVILGRALKDMVNAAQDSGYLCEYVFYDPESIPKIKRSNLLILCTGCQGDELAAVNKLSLSIHPSFKLQEGETIIFSSKIIPGNEKRIAAILNRFVKMDVEVITEKTHNVHVSGHPYRDELKHMYSVVKPRVLIPVHGENVHIHEHAHFAKECGVKHSLILIDGDVVRLAPGKTEKIGKVKSGLFCVDGSNLVAPNSHLMHLRRKMQNAGLIVIIIVIDAKFSILKRPTMKTFGYTENKKWEEKTLSFIQKEVMQSGNLSHDALVNLVTKIVKRNINKKDKIPPIEVHIEQITKEKASNKKLF